MSIAPIEEKIKIRALCTSSSSSFFSGYRRNRKWPSKWINGKTIGTNTHTYTISMVY